MTLNHMGLTEIIRSERHSGFNDNWSFSKGVVRTAFEKVFSPKQDYILFQTTANPVAVSELRKYMAYRTEMSTPWDIRQIQKNDEPVYVLGACDVNNGLKFSNRLVDCYMYALNTLAEQQLSKNVFASYPLVSTDGVHSLNRDPKAIFWPRNFMVVDSAYDSLKKIIDDLSGDAVFKLMKEQQSPQFYHTAEIQVLHDTKIPPLICLDRELRVNAAQLSMFVDFLCQMKESYRNTSCPIDCD